MLAMCAELGFHIAEDSDEFGIRDGDTYGGYPGTPHSARGSRFRDHRTGGFTASGRHLRCRHKTLQIQFFDLRCSCRNVSHKKDCELSMSRLPTGRRLYASEAKACEICS